MEIVVERACGMDIYKDNITTCILTSNGKEIQTFSTKTVFLLQLIDWIKQHECTHVAMESTGVFWKPIVNLLEAEGIEFLVVNAQHMKALPGRKTDVKDSESIAKLLRHGLLKASFIPDRNQRELRELVRYRRSIIEERARQHNRIQKVLEAAHSVAASKNYLGAMYRRTAARKGRKRAAVSVAHAMLRIAYYLLTREEMYLDLGEDYFDKQKQQSIVKYSVRRLENLGYSVTIAKVS
ncbi:IS110 family transposase [Paenibacillus sp. FSL K6-0276]|uniref:IS110 family transposase n=1 Tax=Paenibacillus sp. FSL K6-0276 TaxID=2921450 RepID=UPI0030EDA406